VKTKEKGIRQVAPDRWEVRGTLDGTRAPASFARCRGQPEGASPPPGG
jgi:hypothetical protein